MITNDTLHGRHTHTQTRAYVSAGYTSVCAACWREVLRTPLAPPPPLYPHPCNSGLVHVVRDSFPIIGERRWAMLLNDDLICSFFDRCSFNIIIVDQNVGIKLISLTTWRNTSGIRKSLIFRFAAFWLKELEIIIDILLFFNLSFSGATSSKVVERWYPFSIILIRQQCVTFNEPLPTGAEGTQLQISQLNLP